jgi:hypothetical protein
MQTFGARPIRYGTLVQVGAVLRTFPEINLQDALAAGQVDSKRWLIEKLEELDLSLGNVFVVGGWWGLLPAMMFESELRFDHIRSFDIDPACAPVADALNRPFVIDGWRFKASTLDMLALDYAHSRFSTKRADGSVVVVEERPDTIINTSCEHLVQFSGWWERIPHGKLVILQSNDFRIPAEHVNCKSSLAEFRESAPLSRELFAGELPLPDYRRFMLIGYK